MHFRTAQFFRRHFFIGYGFYNIGAGHEHVGSVAVMKTKSVMAGEYTSPPRTAP